LPSDMQRFKRLRVVFLSNTAFTEVPPQLAACPGLEMLGMRSCRISQWSEDALPSSIRGITLTDNQLSSVPSSVGRMGKLQKLMLSGNHLHDLPRAMLQCGRLDNLRIAVNHFTTAPTWLSKLPSLAWYSDAGNPFSSENGSALVALPTISWNDLQIGEQIGKSPNKNTVYRAQTKDGRAVAVKLYHGQLSTDGSVDDEVRASTIAGESEHLISAMALIANAPGGQLAVALPLIPSSFSQLALPPDFNTLTRDVYPAAQRFEPTVILKTLGDIAIALNHLHAKGVMHGDMYAHNILTDSGGAAYLGDFGGASVYQPGQDAWRERIDSYAFGILMSELLARCGNPGDAQLGRLHELQKRCTQLVTTERPLFSEIVEWLQ
jgi:Protein kinase domain